MRGSQAPTLRDEQAFHTILLRIHEPLRINRYTQRRIGRMRARQNRCLLGRSREMNAKNGSRLSPQRRRVRFKE
jgi:hypothetical protein